MPLDRIYRPIRQELKEIRRLLKRALERTSDKFILKMNRYLFESPGKMIRPALVVFSARTALNQASRDPQLLRIAASAELIHIASLIHDDVIDHASIRHGKKSVNSKWGNEISIALGDYLYSRAFEMIASCKNHEVLRCLAQAMAQMCEGELAQVRERDNLKLEKRQYLVIVKKKTASLMASCCRAGAALVQGKFIYKEALTKFGLNFGIAFQVMDDYHDLTSSPEELGKPTGLDLAMGELTLPFLFLADTKRRKLLEENKDYNDRLGFIRGSLDDLGVLTKTREFVDSYIAKAKESLSLCQESEYRRGLEGLADFINQPFDFA